MRIDKNKHFTLFFHNVIVFKKHINVSKDAHYV